MGRKRAFQSRIPYVESWRRPRFFLVNIPSKLSWHFVTEISHHACKDHDHHSECDLQFLCQCEWICRIVGLAEQVQPLDSVYDLKSAQNSTNDIEDSQSQDLGCICDKLSTKREWSMPIPKLGDVEQRTPSRHTASKAIARNQIWKPIKATFSHLILPKRSCASSAINELSVVLLNRAIELSSGSKEASSVFCEQMTAWSATIITIAMWPRQCTVSTSEFPSHEKPTTEEKGASACASEMPVPLRFC